MESVPSPSTNALNFATRSGALCIFVNGRLDAHVNYGPRNGR